MIVKGQKDPPVSAPDTVELMSDGVTSDASRVHSIPPPMLTIYSARVIFTVRHTRHRTTTKRSEYSKKSHS